MHQYILVPLDDSAFAEQALDQASILASAMNSTLHLISIVQPPNNFPYIGKKVAISLMKDLLQTETERRTRYLEQKAESLGEQGIVVQTLVASGHPAEEILHISTQQEHTLLVMTTHGRSGFRRLLFGSVAMKVVQGAHVPVGKTSVEKLSRKRFKSMPSIRPILAYRPLLKLNPLCRASTEQPALSRG